MGKGRAVAIELNDVVRRELTALTRKHGAPQALAERARIVLAAAGGLKNKEIASKLGISLSGIRYRRHVIPYHLVHSGLGPNLGPYWDCEASRSDRP